MPIVEPVIRPPAEANSLLLQITTGCSANSCIFCGAYKLKPFSVKKYTEIFADIDTAKKVYPDTRKVFLMDGNALVLTNEKLLPILERLNQVFPKLTRISAYANGDDLAYRSQVELQNLASFKLSLIYLGLESGSQKILDKCKKRPTVQEMIQAVQKAQAVGIKSSVMVLLGLGGRELSELHVKETIKALNKMQPKLLSFLTLMLIPGTELYFQAQQNQFQELNAKEFVRETYDLLIGLELKQTVFRSNHASNYLNLEGRLPQDKAQLLFTIQAALQNKVNLKPEFFRGL
ncbi:MAG: radical SAM protein [Candidatus Margulisiibacteriota bacterium]|jgi:radical SAM superfamily enzyme YgiQ (UPF0313 family)